MKFGQILEGLLTNISDLLLFLLKRLYLFIVCTHHFLLGEGEGGEPPTQFSKKKGGGGLTRS